MFFFFSYSTWKNYSLLTSAFDERPYFFLSPVFQGPKIDSHEMNIFASFFLICICGRKPLSYLRQREKARPGGTSAPQL